MQAEPEVTPEEIAAAEIVAAEVVDSEPVFFSMSDADDQPSDEWTADESPADELPSDELLEDESKSVDFDSEVEFVEPLITENALPAEDDETVSSFAPSQAAPIELSQVPEEQMIALERRPSIVRSVSKPIVQTPQMALSAKRYRPPVAVTNVPMGFDRHPSMITTSSQAAASHAASSSTPVIEVMQMDMPSEESVSSIADAEKRTVRSQTMSASNLTPLYLSRAQVRSLTFGGKVTDVEMADKTVCQAFSAGPNQLKLIGTGDGVTQLVVWAIPDKKPIASSDATTDDATTDDSDGAVMRAFEIHVTESVDATGADSEDHTVALNQSIRQAFPDADVVVHHRNDALVVSGRCGSEAIAKKIVRMVRKTCLIPVQDEIVVR